MARRRENILYHLPAVLSLGIVSQVGQIVFLRELLMVFQGNELSLGIILAVWMIWVGAGSRAGAGFAERSGRPLLILSLTAAAAVILLPLSVFMIRIMRGFFSVQPGAYLSMQDMAVSCFLAMAPVCILFGFQFVLLSRLRREREDMILEPDPRTDTPGMNRDGSRMTGAEKTYIGEAAGNALGGLLFSFILVRVFNSFQAAVIAGMLMPAAILLLTRGSPPGITSKIPPKTTRKMTRGIAAAALIAGAAVFPFLGRIDPWAYELNWRNCAPEYQLLETRQSKHGTITAAVLEDQVSFFQSGHLVFSAAGPGAAAPALEEQESVIFAHMAMVQHPDPKRVMLIGGGLRGTLREIARHPVEKIDYIELDPALTGTVLSYLPAEASAVLDDPRVSLVHTDGRLFVKHGKEKYDMIIVDVPDPATAVLNRFYTEEFFRQVRSRLEPGGVFVTGVVSTADLRGLAVANRNGTIYHTLGEVFPVVLPVGERYLSFFAAEEPGIVSADPSVLMERYAERTIDRTAEGLSASGFSPRQYELLFEETRLRRVNWILRNHGRGPSVHLDPPDTGPLFPGSIGEQEAEEKLLPPPVRRFFINSDFRPIGYYYTLLFWNVLTRGSRPGQFEWIMRVEPWWILLAALAAVLAAAGLRVFRLPVSAGAARASGNGISTGAADARFAVFTAVFTTGMSTMALQIALLFSFQSLYGFIYEMVGFITALFMIGLAAGAAAMRLFLKKFRMKASMNLLALVQLGIALFAGIIGVVLPRGAEVESAAALFALFSAVTLAAGFLNGIDFPVTLACTYTQGGSPERSAGAVYGTELFGACAGAVLSSAVIIPVMGIPAACLFAAVGNGTAFIVLMISRRSYGLSG